VLSPTADLREWWLLRDASILSWEEIKKARSKWPSSKLCEVFGCLFVHLFCFVVSTGVWSQGCALARQALYHFSHSTSPFCIGYFELGSHFICEPTWTTILLFAEEECIVGMTGTHNCPQPFIEMRSHKLFLRGLALNHHPLNLHLPWLSLQSQPLRFIFCFVMKTIKSWGQVRKEGGGEV
jgi:hypothetical protein